jgi:hypothetical protein
LGGFGEGMPKAVRGVPEAMFSEASGTIAPEPLSISLSVMGIFLVIILGGFGEGMPKALKGVSKAMFFRLLLIG